MDAAVRPMVAADVAEVAALESMATESMTGMRGGPALLADQPNYRHSMPTKILEYMAGGTPVVSTPLPLSQLVIGTDGVVLRDFDRSPQEIADAVIRLCDDADTRERFARVGFARVHDHYNWHHAQHDFIRALGL